MADLDNKMRDHEDDKQQAGSRRTTHSEIENIPPPNMKIKYFSIEKLKSENARLWFHTTGMQLKLHRAWDAIETYDKIGDEEFTLLCQTYANWDDLNLKASMVIEAGLSQATVLDCASMTNAGRQWQYVKERYYRRSHGDITRMCCSILKWKYAGRSIVEAFCSLERLNNELKDMNPDMAFNDKHIVLIFLIGLCDSEYESIANNLMFVPGVLQSDIYSAGSGMLNP